MARTQKKPQTTAPDTVQIVGRVRPGSPLDRLFSHGECLIGCGRKADAPNALCATCQAEAEASR
ncbi:conserved hypothetical protein [Frankia sp. Hr75.2]|nr:conserved hypothetical protein [Frankia sp. Hr75.2]